MVELEVQEEKWYYNYKGKNMKLYYKNKNKSKSRYQVRWSTDLRYRLAEYSGAFGGVGV